MNVISRRNALLAPILPVARQFSGAIKPIPPVGRLHGSSLMANAIQPRYGTLNPDLCEYVSNSMCRVLAAVRKGTATAKDLSIASDHIHMFGRHITDVGYDDFARLAAKYVDFSRPPANEEHRYEVRSKILKGLQKYEPSASLNDIPTLEVSAADYASLGENLRTKAITGSFHEAGDWIRDIALQMPQNIASTTPARFSSRDSGGAVLLSGVYVPHRNQSLELDVMCWWKKIACAAAAGLFSMGQPAILAFITSCCDDPVIYDALIASTQPELAGAFLTFCLTPGATSWTAGAINAILTAISSFVCL